MVKGDLSLAYTSLILSWSFLRKASRRALMYVFTSATWLDLSVALLTREQFERGTISYLITATITRPTSIAATSNCDTKISLVESVDIGSMAPPKPRIISLEPISRKMKRTKSTRHKENEASQDAAEPGTGADSARVGSPLPDESASQCGSMDHHAGPRSPVPSDMRSTISTATSADSTASSSTGISFRLGNVPSSARSTRHSQNTSSKVSLADQTITANIELLKSGCLPGDNIPIKITINHAKAIKSMHGIIITLYRQGRIDSAPPLSLFGDITGKEADRLKHEEYYPKSKTGLGGLSLSSAGSSSMFRKDLAQTFAPILVDPITLTAVVHASVRAPEDVFPTIKGVPGEMISFKYHIEVVLDLGGKLAGQQKHIPGVGAVSGPSGAGIRADGGSNMLAAWGGSIVDTANIRREKSVVACLFDLVVGTMDSSRIRGRANSSRTRVNDWSQEATIPPPPVHEPIYEESVAPSAQHGYSQGEIQPYPYHEHEHQHSYDERYHEYYNEGYGYEDQYHAQHQHHHEVPEYIPGPEMPEEGLTDKERARKAEERLLPSQPPPSFSAGPSRPPVEHEDLYNADDNVVTGSGFHPLAPVSSNRTLGPTAPELRDLADGAVGNATEDKQELERRRLMGEVSAPSFPDDDDAGEGGSGSAMVNENRMMAAPSAPELVDDGFHGSDAMVASGSGSGSGSGAGPSRRETLPAYER